MLNDMSKFLKLTSPLLSLIISSTFLCSCKPTGTSEASKPTTFSDYQSAEIWIKKNFKAETITPNSSLFKKIEYYPSGNSGYLIIYHHRGKVPTLLYENINQRLWNALKNAESKGKFYKEKIQGNEGFMFEVGSEMK